MKRLLIAAATLALAVPVVGLGSLNGVSLARTARTPENLYAAKLPCPNTPIFRVNSERCGVGDSLLPGTLMLSKPATVKWTNTGGRSITIYFIPFGTTAHTWVVRNSKASRGQSTIPAGMYTAGWVATHDRWTLTVT
ncbi:MAG: hypothetical protein ABSG64_10815 [Solirubrobacteraceae bacterium]|jgi:hypothetical protein